MAQLFSLGSITIMNKITSRDIRSFVAGALAFNGFKSLILIPHYFTLSMDASHIGRAVIVALVAGLALPIGIGIFLGRWSALFSAQIFLWMKVILGCMTIPYFCIFFHEKVVTLVLVGAPEILGDAVLLGLIFWTTSERFRHEPDV